MKWPTCGSCHFGGNDVVPWSRAVMCTRGEVRPARGHIGNTFASPATRRSLLSARITSDRAPRNAWPVYRLSNHAEPLHLQPTTPALVPPLVQADRCSFLMARVCRDSSLLASSLMVLRQGSLLAASSVCTVRSCFCSPALATVPSAMVLRPLACSCRRERFAF